MNTKKLLDTAISLPVEERTLLIDSLLQSLNQPDTDIDRQWAVAAQQRLIELRSGVIKPIPGDAVFEKVWSRFNK
jgi:hypothetical protein